MSKRPAPSSKKLLKKARLFSSRQIRSEINDPAFKDGVLDVPAFINSRKYEIDQLEKSQLKSKHASSTRVFQSLPRKLRRRAASHNVKRIPKRLRNRAIREMKSSGQEVNAGKKLSSREVYRLKMSRNLLRLVGKLNARKIIPTEDLMNKNVRGIIKSLKKQLLETETSTARPLNNSYGLYDNTGIGERAPALVSKVKYLKRQKNFKWILTHIWHAKRFHMLKRHGWNIPYKPTQKCFRLTHRSVFRDGATVFDTSFEGCIIASGERKLLEDTLTGLTGSMGGARTILNGSLFHNGDISVSGEIVGVGIVYAYKHQEKHHAYMQVSPGAFEAVWTHLQQQNLQLQDCSTSLGSIHLVGPNSLGALSRVLRQPHDKEWRQAGSLSSSSLPSQSVISLLIEDPRYFRKARSAVTVSDEDCVDLILNISRGKFRDQSIMTQLFTAEGREQSYKGQMSIKDINNKRGKLKEPQGNISEGVGRVPVLLLVDKRGVNLICPWFWTSPIWYKLVAIPRVYPGGLLQRYQIEFENKRIFFPNDYPFSTLGAIENEMIGLENRKKWSRRPKSKRVNYDNVVVLKSDLEKWNIRGEICDWENCDWFFLAFLECAKSVWGAGLESLQSLAGDLEKEKQFLARFAAEKKNTVKEMLELASEIKKSSNFSEKFIGLTETSTTVKVTPVILRLDSGKVKDNARIYSYHGAKEPSILDLRGFVTSASFNLSEGECYAIGCVVGNKDEKFSLRNIGSRKIVQASPVKWGLNK